MGKDKDFGPGFGAGRAVAGVAAEVQHHVAARYLQVVGAGGGPVFPIEVKAQPAHVETEGLGVVEDAEDGRYHAREKPVEPVFLHPNAVVPALQEAARQRAAGSVVRGLKGAGTPVAPGLSGYRRNLARYPLIRGFSAFDAAKIRLASGRELNFEAPPPTPFPTPLRT